MTLRFIISHMHVGSITSCCLEKEPTFLQTRETGRNQSMGCGRNQGRGGWKIYGGGTNVYIIPWVTSSHPPPPKFPLHYNFLCIILLLILPAWHIIQLLFSFHIVNGAFLFCKHYLAYQKAFFLIKMICSLNCPVFLISPQTLIEIL